MTVYLDKEKKRIVCRWMEPTQYIMNKRPVVIERSKYIWARITKSGKVSKTDKNRYGKHPMFGHIQRFSREIEHKGLLDDKDAQMPCSVCGSLIDTVVAYDPHEKNMAWLCRKHLAIRNASN